MKSPLAQLLVSLILAVAVATSCGAQSSDEQCCTKDSDSGASADPQNGAHRAKPERNYVKRFVQDQKTIWGSPLRVRREQLPLLLGLGFSAASLTQADTDIERHISDNRVSLATHASDAGVALFAGTAATLFLVGTVKGDDHARETGVLASEAAFNALLTNTVLQKAVGRARPEDAHPGDFLKGGSSFPSNHSAVAWAAASVFAHEYPGWGTKMLSYGLATAVSAARVDGRKHFASDVLVGSALGWFIGQQVYRTHHDQNLPGANWGTFQRADYDSTPDPMHQGSVYVPLDSWIYEAFDRLAALGYAPAGFQNMRPWTRMECARLLRATDNGFDFSGHTQVASLRSALRNEFADDLRVFDGERNLALGVDSAYTRFTGITGQPLTDGYHFGQTIINDFGRPYQNGSNFITGFSTHGEAGPFAFYVRGEYQHAPAAPALSDALRDAIAAVDQLPVQPLALPASINRFRFLDSYVALNISGWQASFGKQSLWWGHGNSGDLMYSNNAEPITMLRLNRITPFKLPSVLGVLGEIRSDSFLGQLEGYHFLRLGPTFVLTGSYNHDIDPQPYIWGTKLSLAPTPNLQLGVSVTTVFSGLGRPLTFGTFLHTLSSRGNNQQHEPGDRRTGFDFSYRIPGLRRWLVLYNGSMSEDEPNPIAYPRRSAMNPGVYLPQMPILRKLDLHVESGYTNLPNDRWSARFYRNVHYAGGYTNHGQIMGSWLGPEARAYQAWSNYWLSGQSKFQFSYRRQTVDSSYLGGGNLQDFGGSYDFVVRSSLAVSTTLQYERWSFPVLAARPQSNAIVSLQFTYKPSWLSNKR